MHDALRILRSETPEHSQPDGPVAHAPYDVVESTLAHPTRVRRLIDCPTGETRGVLDVGLPPHLPIVLRIIAWLDFDEIIIC